ncbi:MAG: alpha/beta fold hydrolase [Pseudomonadota bacterium]
MMRRLLGVWLILIIASNLWRKTHPVMPSADAAQRLVTVSQRNGATATGEDARIAIREYGQRQTDRTPVLLLHGTPYASLAMRKLGQLLADDYYVISPDLPGFAGSAQPLPDYASETHAHYLAELLTKLDIEQAHVVAYSQGGAAAISMAHHYSDRTASLSLLSTIGVQELELFGSYRINHAVYAGQLAIWRAAQWLLPHFGYLDNAILGTGYARNLTDTDQRVIRSYLSTINMPTLIVHGRDDGLVPYAAALEHYRLLPHSSLVTVEGGHEIVYATPGKLIAPLRDFLLDVNAGTATERASASAARTAAANAPYDPMSRDAVTGFALIVMMLAIIVASYVSEDLTCIATGLLVAEGIISLPMGILACLIGLFTGDLALFLAGRWLGPPTLRRLTSAQKLASATAWLKQRGPLVIISSRFVPGTRLPTYLAAGALRMPMLQFVGYFLIATLIWTPLLVSIAAAYGDIAEQWFSRYASTGVWFLVSGAIVLWLLLQLLTHAASWAGRRQLVGRWRRLTRFEFWPRWAFYWPVVLANVAFAIRYQSLTLFTLANPGMPLGGLRGEPKDQILNQLTPSGSVAPYAVVPAVDEHTQHAQRMSALHAFVEQTGTSYPIVLKPNCGERGRDVQIIDSADEAERYVLQHPHAIIAQRKQSGHEYGVLYARIPGDACGSIRSIAHKGATIVYGDGHTPLKTLVLRDARAVCMAPFFLNEHNDQLDRIPARQEAVALSSIGTHSRGSVFTDANALDSPALTHEIDRISRHFDGFYLGRYDLFVPDADALQAGQSISVIELNGVTSEPAHVYHPGRSVWRAWRDVISQWHLAWKIGAALRRQGLRPPGALTVIRGLRDPQTIA